MRSKESGSGSEWLPTRRSFGVVLVALAMVLAGCGGGGGGGGEAGGGQATTTAGGEATTAADETTSTGGETTTATGDTATTAADDGTTTTATGGETTTAASDTSDGDNVSMDNGSAMSGGDNASMGNGSEMGQMASNASVRIAHMSPDAPAVDVYVDNETVVSGAEFGAITEYTTLATGEHVVTITAADNRSAVVFNDTVGLDAAAYTVAATGEISENATQPFAPLILQDSTSPPMNSSVVRLAHVSPDAGPVDVTVEGTNLTLFDNATYANATDYVEVPAGEYTLEVRAATAANNGTIVHTLDAGLENGTAYTAFAAGYASPDDAPADESLEVFATTDGRTAELRVAHMSPDAPAVDVYVDNETAVSGIEYGEVTDYVATTPGEHAVTITAADNRSAVVFDGTVPFMPGDYTVAATGEVGENASQPFAPLILDDNATAPGENASAVRVVHVAPDAPAVDITVNETGNALVDDLAFGNATDYVEVPAGEYTLDVRPATANNDGPIVESFDVELENGTAYTGFAAGYLDPENASGDEAFDLIVVTDAENTSSGSESNEIAHPSENRVRTVATN
jgi:hypothetical protein